MTRSRDSYYTYQCPLSHQIYCDHIMPIKRNSSFTRLTNAFRDLQHRISVVKSRKHEHIKHKRSLSLPSISSEGSHNDVSELRREITTGYKFKQNEDLGAFIVKDTIFKRTESYRKTNVSELGQNDDISAGEYAMIQMRRNAGRSRSLQLPRPNASNDFRCNCSVPSVPENHYFEMPTAGVIKSTPASFTENNISQNLDLNKDSVLICRSLNIPSKIISRELSPLLRKHNIQASDGFACKHTRTRRRSHSSDSCFEKLRKDSVSPKFRNKYLKQNSSELTGLDGNNTEELTFIAHDRLHNLTSALQAKLYRESSEPSYNLTKRGYYSNTGHFAESVQTEEKFKNFEEDGSHLSLKIDLFSTKETPICSTML